MITDDDLASLRAALAAENERAENAERERDEARANAETFRNSMYALESRVDELARECERLRDGVSSIAHCQSGVTRAEMREAAAEIMAGASFTDMCDQSPFVASMSRYKTERDAAIARAEAAEAECARLSGIIERDRTKAAEIISAARAVVTQRSWLVEGRGCYSYDDKTYQHEFGAVFTDLLAALEPLKVLAADWSDCPKDFQAARINWKERAEGAEALLREARDSIQDYADDLVSALVERQQRDLIARIESHLGAKND